ncbi:hypothetical protein [Clostridium sp. AM58-1XD]|uniref:hypothetical protein n=1 Tax=Clostridium sp. AM58-1XD TaxID=2292307 RepID=UPI000E47E258|nr:hypothetical protein [Clostridium sp. AM58-1XD]RGY96823.1 hypothetical protein DXA13_16135 [Clostridium sp. AM58-1XD]
MKKHLTKTRMACYILLLGTFCLLLPVTYARYAAQVKGEAAASIAAWGSDSSDFTIDVSGLYPGKTQDYQFAVTNKKGDRVSEVSQKYSITVDTTGNLPLKFQIDAGSGLPSGSLVNTGELAVTAGKARTEGGFLPHSSETVHNYVLKVSWPEGNDNNSSDYADEIDLVTVTVNAEQAEPEEPAKPAG